MVRPVQGLSTISLKTFVLQAAFDKRQSTQAQRESRRATEESSSCCPGSAFDPFWVRCAVGELKHPCSHAGPNDQFWLPLSLDITLTLATPKHPTFLLVPLPKLPLFSSLEFSILPVLQDQVQISPLPQCSLTQLAEPKSPNLWCVVYSSHVRFNSLDTMTTYDRHTQEWINLEVPKPKL